METFEEACRKHYEKYREGSLKCGVINSLGGWIMPKDVTEQVIKTIKNNKPFSDEKNIKIPTKGEIMPIFEVCIVEMPSKNETDEGELEKLVLGPVAVVAKDKDSAGAVVVMENSDKLKDVKKSRMKLLIRPFV